MGTGFGFERQNRSERVQELLGRVQYKRFSLDEDREPIFRLRHDAYLREGAIAEQDGLTFSDEVDFADNTFLFGVFVDDELAGSMRISVTLPECRALPTAHVFPDLVEPELDRGRIIIDPTRFVADYAISRRIPELPYLTLRLPWMAMEHFGADLMLIAVRPEHQPFYKRLWNAAVACEARAYPKLKKPVGLSVLDFAAARMRVLERHPYFESDSQERERLFAPDLSASALPVSVPEAWQIANFAPEAVAIH